MSSSSAGMNTTRDNSFMSQAKRWSFTAENFINKAAAPLKPYLPHIGRFLLVVTFLEDALRICVQYPDQVSFMKHYRNCHPVLAHLFLTYCVGAMASGSVLALARIKMFWACGLLMSVVVLQSFGYGIFRYFSFMMRNLSLVGGILLLLGESMEHERKLSGRGSSSVLFRGLPLMGASEGERSTYVSLIGRVLLIFLFGSLMYSSGGGSSSGPFAQTLRFVYLAFGSAACLMVAVGFKAQYSAMLLVAILCIANILMNQWWKHGQNTPEHDFLRYDFFQTLSIIGGFLLLLNSGPGELSFDKRRKDF
jgi:uncharacterized membrane protein YphA (DoxX/SURF4 family)